VKIDSVTAGGSKTLEQAKAEIATKLTQDKRKSAIEDLVDKVQNMVDNGGNFSEAVGAAKLPVTTTPLITASGSSRSDASFKLPPELAPALKTGFDIAPNDPPEIVTLPGDSGYAVVSPGQVIPSAPSPLASIREQVAGDWINDQASKRAQAAATQIAAKASGSVSLADAVKGAGAAIAAPQPVAARRIQLTNAQGNVPPALKLLFGVGPGHSRMAPLPQGGFVVVKVDKVIPGNALVAPGLISQVQGELNQASSQDYAQQFISDVRRHMKAKRNESAIEAFKARLVSSSG
jgi:peptidyl-prolyl cis-trans isomerase D